MSISIFELQQMQARLAQKKVRQSDGQTIPMANGCEREKELHDRILEECAARGWLVIHSRMDMPSNVGIGVPDFAVFCAGGRVLLVEAKTRDGKLTPKQRAWLAWAQKLGHLACVARSFNDFVKFAAQCSSVPAQQNYEYS